MNDLDKICISVNENVINTIKQLDISGKKIVFVLNEQILVGVVTDGDIRRWILKNGDLNMNVTNIMNRNPIYLYEYERYQVRERLKAGHIQAIPIIDRMHRILDVVFWNDVFDKEHDTFIYNKVSCPVVIMAGGKGTRLYPYTKILPKPLIPIGDLTIIEHIINRFREFKCDEFYLTVNYKKNMIKAYLDEKITNYHLEYIEEEKFLGTGGSLYLLKDKIKGSFFLSNCDVLVEANYAELLNYHKKNEYKITMVTSLKNYVIPYGVIESEDGGEIKRMLEKPEFNFQVNTGLYVLEPEILDEIPENEFFHITDLINKYINRGEKVGIYPITGNSWLDMGEIKEMENMINQLKLDDK